jgi:GMP synthase-like glutamine amidotransferase
MKAHCIMHVPFEGPGYIEDWFNSHGIQLIFWRMYKSTELPEQEEVDFLLIMGGPMNIYEYDKYPWLKAEKSFLKTCIVQGKKILGICLGSQLIADTLGEKIYKGSEKEIGWFPVAGDKNILQGSFIPFHWHGETYNLPDGADHLASSLVTKNQAFSYDKNVLALQFHLEVNETLIEGLLKNASNDLTAGEWVQTPEEIRNGLEHAEVNRKALFRMLEDFTGMKEDYG